MPRFLTDEEYGALLKENYALKAKVDSLMKGSFIAPELSKANRRINKLEKMVKTRDKKLEKLDGELYRANKKIEELEKIIEELTAENNKYKIQIDKDYTNSSFPSSSETFVRKVKNSRVKSDRKPGGQLGHKGHPRKDYKPDETILLPCDETIINNPDYIKTGKVLKRKLVDISFDMKVIEYQSVVYKNIKTGKSYHSPFPEGVDNEINYSSKIKAVAYYLNNHCNVSIDHTKDFIKLITDNKICLSKGMISNLNKQLHFRSLDKIKEYFNTLSKADVLYLDNTSSRVNGRNEVVFVTTDKNIAFYSYTGHKGHEGVKLTPVASSLATLVHDHDKTFYSYGKNHQECLAHLLRYLQSSIDYEPHLSWAKYMKELLQDIIHQIKNSELNEKLKDKYKKRYKQIIHIGLKEYRKHPPNEYFMDGFNLLKRMREYEDSTLYFLDHPQIDYTNNISESLLRKVKRKTHQATTFRSIDNLSYYCEGLSIIETSRIRNENPLTELIGVFDTPKKKIK